MMEWSDYLASILSYDGEFDGLTISLDDGHSTTNIPPIIKASIIMLDKINEKQEKRNVLILPEKIQSIFIFILMSLFHNISSGKIKSNYDPTNFSKNERLKVGNAVVEYLGTEIRDGKICIMIKLADLDSCSAPIEHLPVFQKANTQRRLSKYAQYKAAIKLATERNNLFSTGNANLIYAANMKTHMDSSIFVMTSVAGAKEQIFNCRIGGKRVTDVFFLGQSDYEGNITNIGPGQLAGIPAIIYAPDLYAINAAIENHNPIQSIIIDASNMGALINQLDALDELLRNDVPVVCITDVSNSFELEQLSLRDFNIWRWDSDSLTDQLYGATTLSMEQKIENCAKQDVQYLKVEGEEVSEVMRVLAGHREETQDQSPQVMKLFDKLNSLTFKALRQIIPFSNKDIDNAQIILTDCETILQKESPFLDISSYMDYTNAISLLKKIYSSIFILQKVETLKKYLKEYNIAKVYLVISEKSSKSIIQNYWENWCLQNLIRTKIKVIFPSEYYAISNTDTGLTIICGWLKRAIMRKIIFSYNTSKYIVMLYDCENKWKNYDTKKWTKVLSNSGNKKIVEKFFSSDVLKISTTKFEKTVSIDESEDTSDELGEIELILHENKFNQYVSRGTHSGNDTVSAIPISFVGGYLAFYRTSHKVISATKIILNGFEKIESKLPYELQIGDFIVVRETDRDLIKEIADIVLANSGKSILRELAGKWRESLKIALIFDTLDELYNKLKKEGCKRGLSTVKHWIENEDVIAPQTKNDLKLIAKVTHDEELLKNIDKVYDAAQEVRQAHVLAGKKLSEQLKRTLAAELKSYRKIDPFNFWEPINMEIDRIGNVKVLKIIDIGSEIEINSADTNRLMEE